jgi:transposase
MPSYLRVRSLTAEEERVIARLARSQTASGGPVRRAQGPPLGSQGQTVPQIAAELGLDENTARKWFNRFNEQGLAGLEDAPRSGAPSRYTAENQARVVATAKTRPTDLGLPYRSWTFERLASYLHDELELTMKKTRIFEILQDEGWRWRKQETWFGERLDPEFASKRGRSKPSVQPHPPTA